MEVKEKNEEVKENVDEIPTFTPPSKDDEIPTFEAPKNANPTGEVCYHHQNEPAVGHCARCGKAICKDCAESCAVGGGEYKGKNLCYDCCKALFEEDKDKLKKDKNKIMIQYILTLVGVILGASIGISEKDAVVAVICAMIGGSLLVAIKPIGSAFWEITKGIIEAAAGGGIAEAIINVLTGIFKFIIVAIQCTIRTISKIIRYTIYLIKASKAIKQDMEALQQLQDFMQYMEVTSNNKGVDLETLMQDGSELYNNSYARVLRDSGEEAADQMLRQATTIIAENGEIIRNFVAA